MLRKKALSAVVAVVLLLMMTVAAAGFAYVFISGTQKSAGDAASASLEKIGEEASKCMAIDSVYANKLYVRNCGQGVLKQADLKLFVNGRPANYSASFAEIRQGDTKEISVAYPAVRDSNKIEIKGAQGCAASKDVPKQSIQNGMNSDPALVGYWKFDDGTGTRAADSSGKGNAGTLTNFNFDATDGWVDGKIGKALKFDGSNDFVGISNVPVNTASGAANTAEFWMNWGAQSGVMPFGWGSSYDLFFSDACFGINTGQGNILGFSSSGFANNWKHVVSVFPNGVPSAVNSAIYINGEKMPLTNCVGATTASKTATSSLYISGWGTSGGYKFKGIIDNVRIYNRALTGEEAKTLYELGCCPQ